MIGIFSDSHGDLGAFDAAYELLRARGAKRFYFAGGRFSDLDEWILQKREEARGGREYGDADFLADVAQFLTAAQPVATREKAPPLKDSFLRTPERECLQYLDGSAPRKAVDMIGDTLACLVHDKNDLTRDDLLNATVFIHGKEPEPRVRQIGPRFFVTPGKLTGAAEQTCALIEAADGNLRFSAFTLEGRLVVDGQVLALERRTRLSVK